MRTAVGEQADATRSVAEEHEDFAEEPHEYCRPLRGQLGGDSDGHPVAAKQLAARRTRSNAREQIVVLFSEHHLRDPPALVWCVAYLAGGCAFDYTGAPRRAMTASVLSVTQLRAKVVLSCRMIGSRGVSKGSFGHVSARIPDADDKILIKSKGPDEEALEFTTDRDIIRLDLDGRVLEAPSGLQAPAETAMHLAIYRARPEIMSVIHSHPLWVVVLTACDKPLVGMYGANSTVMRRSAFWRRGCRPSRVRKPSPTTLWRTSFWKSWERGEPVCYAGTA